VNINSYLITKSVIRETYNNYGHNYTGHMNLKEVNIKEDRSIKREQKKCNVIKNR